MASILRPRGPLHLAQPTARDLHVDTPLTNVLIGYQNLSYIADQMFAIVPVKNQSDIVPKYLQSAWFRDDAKARTSGTKSRGGGFGVDTTDHYFCPRFSRRFEIPDDVRRNADSIWQLDVSGARFVTDRLFMKREVAFATNNFVSTPWGTLKTGGADFTVWSNYGASNPLVDMDAWKDTVEGKLGAEPTRFAIGKAGHLQIKNHPQLIERIKYTQRAQITPELIASLMELDQYLVGRAIYTTSPEGTAEASVTYTRIWGKHGLLLYRPEAPSLMMPAAGYTIVWTAAGDGMLQYIKRMRDEEKEIDIIEGNTYFTQHVTVANAGLFVSGIVS